MLKNFLKVGFISMLLGMSSFAIAQPTLSVNEIKPTTEKIIQLPKVNINIADAQALQKNLKGIGKKRAEAIIEYREKNGPFIAIDQLQEIPGIGKATIDKNKDIIEL